MARVMIFTTETTCNLNANRIELDEDYVKVYNNDKFVGIFDLSVVRGAYVSEKERKE